MFDLFSKDHWNQNKGWGKPRAINERGEWKPPPLERGTKEIVLEVYYFLLRQINGGEPESGWEGEFFFLRKKGQLNVIETGLFYEKKIKVYFYFLVWSGAPQGLKKKGVRIFLKIPYATNILLN